MNICLRHKKLSLQDKNKLAKLNKDQDDNNDFSYKYFLCKFCGVLIDENDEVYN